MNSDLHDINTATEFYDNRYEDGYMEEWDELKKEKVRETIRSLNLPASGSALDFGCGNGVFTKIIKEVLPNWEVYGVEISRVAVQNAKRKNPDCIFFEATESSRYFNQFDFLFSHHVIEHVQNLEETFTTINNYLNPVSFQLHILPCGNAGSYEYEICKLKIKGIDPNSENRFFFEEPGHLRRLNTEDFIMQESKIDFKLSNAWYSNQKYGAINWITKSSPRFVKRLTNTADAIDKKSIQLLSSMRRKLLPLTYLQFPYSKYWLIKNQWRKKFLDYIKLAILFIPAMIAKPFYFYLQNKAKEEWSTRKTEMNGSEMYLFFKR